MRADDMAPTEEQILVRVDTQKRFRHSCPLLVALVGGLILLLFEERLMRSDGLAATLTAGEQHAFETFVAAVCFLMLVSLGFMWLEARVTHVALSNGHLEVRTKRTTKPNLGKPQYSARASRSDLPGNTIRATTSSVSEANPGTTTPPCRPPVAPPTRRRTPATR